VSWKLVNRKPVVSVRAPAGETWVNRPAQIRHGAVRASRHSKPAARPRFAAQKSIRVVSTIINHSKSFIYSVYCT
jgi:hypothetical protein